VTADRISSDIYEGAYPRVHGGRNRGGAAKARWKIFEFSARVTDQLSEPSQQTVRHWGYYANAARGKRRKAAQTGDPAQVALPQNDDELIRRASAELGEADSPSR
jgi:hypothetical protein